MTYEGHEVADWYNEYGVTGFVLRYRLAPRYKHPSPMQDVQRAIRMVRANAKEFGIDPNRIGVMGFSAGGHLASTAATHFDDGDSASKDPIDRVSCRPDFAVLAYPVITFGEFTHTGSRDNLLGKNPDPKLVELMSNEKQVTDKTPPTFLFHTGTDTAVPPENSLLFYAAMRKVKVPAELHVYEEGRHGVGLATKDPTLSTWPECLATWLEHRKLLEKKK
jgi:acetyl esterase/lipase